MVSSRNASESRIALSSSTTWMRASFAIARAFPNCRQRKAENGASPLVRLSPQPAAMRLDDSSADRQANAHSMGLRGHEGLEQLVRHLLRQSRAGIGHGKLEHVAGNWNDR